ncbi:cation transporter [Nocardiopsis sp. TSRI0078]|uniref:Na+/H+ antiporter subunit E n=1 Tax=unclassified Nocardiopsis TaxID=2649073 RepID=UPI00093C1598|nr:Na+/H+ antiporter subunit E [Nocardiopsis sp. TSRI0078]OKI23521.1 cation transporter [Nocardiopsis sp. TSRI0078]
MTKTTNPRKRSLGLISLRRRLGKVQIPVALGMTLVWMLLFKGFQPRPESLGLLVLGFLVSVLIMVLFPMPPITPGPRFHPVNLVRLFLHVLVEMVLASFQVTVLTFRPGRVHSSVVAVRMRTDSDLMMVCTAIAASVIPGTLIVEVNRPERILYVHMLGVGDDEAVEKGRRDVWKLERRFVMALGTQEDIAALRAGGPEELEEQKRHEGKEGS